MTTETQDFWENHYGERDRVWSGQVNARLAEIAEELPAGRALDLGCGEGADAIWLAERGWQVVAVDVSTTALQRAADDARAHGVLERIDFQHHDLSTSFPEGSFDLVSAQFLHSPLELDRDPLLRRAAQVVASDGLLVIVDHAAAPPGSKIGHDHHFPTAEEVIDGLAVDESTWRRMRVETVEREAVRDGELAVFTDNVIVLRRR